MSTLSTYSKALAELIHSLQETYTTVRVKIFGHMGYVWEQGEDVSVELQVVPDLKKKTTCTIKVYTPGGKPGVLYPMNALLIKKIVVSFIDKSYQGLYSSPCEMLLDEEFGFGRVYIKKPHTRIKDQWGFCATCYRRKRYKNQVINLHTEPYAYQHLYEDINEYSYGHYVSPIGRIVYHYQDECLAPVWRFPSITGSEHDFKEN